MFWISYCFPLGSFSLDHSSVLGMDIFEVHVHTKCFIAYQATWVFLLCHHDLIQFKHLWKAEYFKVPCTGRKAMPNNVQTTAQLHSYHMLAKKCSKFFKQGFNSMWTENFQMFKLDLEKAEELEIKLPKPVGSSKKQKNSGKTSASLTMLKPLMCGSQQTVENS